jgi:hypothetical protein
MMRIRAVAMVMCAGAILLLGLGCYKTQYSLSPEGKGTVQTAYVGDYAITDNGKTSSLIIRNINDHLYYVEWIDADGKSPTRMVGFTSDVNGVTFANLRELTDDGTIDNQYLIMRVALSADESKLTLQNLKDDFFKDKNINSADALRSAIAGNLDNAAMYDGDAVVATRVAATTQPGQ